jgi:tetratricopeptide (TPR) repeat protein
VLHQLGVISFLRRDFDTAERYLKRSLPLFTELGETEAAARSRYQLGMVRRGEGQYMRAEEDFRAALELARQAHSAIVIGQCLQATGDVCFAQGDIASARRALDECIKLRRDSDDRPSLANSLNTSSQVAVAEGRLDEAKRLLQECMTISREERLDGILSDALTGMAMVCQLEGDHARADATIHESITAAEVAHDPTKVVTASLIAARLAEAAGRNEEAVRHLIAATGFSHLVEPTLAETVIVKLILAEGKLSKADVTRLYKEYGAARRQAKRKPRPGE